MKKWNMIVDVAECHNCNNCFLSCKDEYIGNDYPGYSAPQPLHGHQWIKILSKERGSYPMADVAYVPTMCNHCDDAPCIAAGRGAVNKRDDGIVIIDPEKARGKKEIVDACPFGAIWWNEELQLPQAWTFDAHLLDSGWQQPRCVQACPTGALKSIKVSDGEMAKIVESEKLVPLMPEYQTRPRVHYKNLHRYQQLFIAGNLLVQVEETTDCAVGIEVVLLKDETHVSTAVSDVFGEFKFDDLTPNSGDYQIRFSDKLNKYQTLEIVVSAESLALVDIFLMTQNPGDES
jgi:Fe-S-cluster-containing dehydrogenase component